MYETLMEAVVADENYRPALEAVQRNRGAGGIDRMTTEQLEPRGAIPVTRPDTGVLPQNSQPAAAAERLRDSRCALTALDPASTSDCSRASDILNSVVP